MSTETYLEKTQMKWYWKEFSMIRCPLNRQCMRLMTEDKAITVRYISRFTIPSVVGGFSCPPFPNDSNQSGVSTCLTFVHDSNRSSN